MIKYVSTRWNKCIMGAHSSVRLVWEVLLHWTDFFNLKHSQTDTDQQCPETDIISFMSFYSLSLFYNLKSSQQQNRALITKEIEIWRVRDIPKHKPWEVVVVQWDDEVEGGVAFGWNEWGNSKLRPEWSQKKWEAWKLGLMSMTAIATNYNKAVKGLAYLHWIL